MDLTKVTISTERLKLVPVSKEYSKTIFQEFTQEVTKYMIPKPAETIEDTLAFISSAQEKLAKGKALNVAILLSQTGEFLGGGGIDDINTNTPVLGIWIKKGAHGHKYGREAVKGLKEWAERHLQYEYLIYPVDKRNIPSRKIAESIGGIIGKNIKTINQSGNELDEYEYLVYKK